VRIAIRSGDSRFIAAAKTVVGALGHEPVDGDGPAEAVICDVATINFPSLGPHLDRLTTVLFVPVTGGDAAGLLAARFAHVFPRTALAVELPRALATIAAGAVG
jgi:hypothetical protein